MKIRIRLERVTRIRRWDERRENENEEKLVKEKIVESLQNKHCFDF